MYRISTAELDWLKSYKPVLENGGPDLLSPGVPLQMNLRIVHLQYRSKYKYHSVVIKRYKVRFHVGKKMFNDFKKNGDFFLRTGVSTGVFRCLLPIYACLTICADNHLLLHPLVARLSTEIAPLFLLFGIFVASLFVSRRIQMFTSDSRHCRFHCVSLFVVRCRPSRPFIR